ncbi:hypothetical protein K432DRAFT_381968 [Lepidopterella palustris CBS 459.81]|uniref:DUF2406 domain-containing protein n=1 Tax=Lepidopterella palustris CBS 459.81 TaxID=1314670 RepID=A0A8E2EAY6_9PEZI|nr:hypothetical protein K432DRAFT_381968 [Lepidopterella palustris CBS 459.81]
MSVMEQPQPRPRSKSTFSFKSDKSHSSGHEKKPKESLRESSEEKRRTHFTPATKADPNAAMNENQPIAAALEKPTLQSLRSFQHTDVNGNPIAEPDLSNPTRPRWERPLDTIRSFEAAIDNGYKRRSSVMRQESSPDVMNGYTSRRSSYYGGNDQQRYSQVGGYYGSRAAAASRDSYVDNGYGPSGPPRSRYNYRLQSDPSLNRYNTSQGVYPTQGYQQSRDTVNTGGSNGSHSEPWAGSTDPSSENSSIERNLPGNMPGNKPDLGEQYGFTGFGGSPIMEDGNEASYGLQYGGGPSSNGNGGYYPQQQDGNFVPPQVPPKLLAPNNPNVIKLGGGYGQQPTTQANEITPTKSVARSNTDKRKSWFKRRFSKD